MKPRFTTGELARLHGISKQTLIFYDHAGVFCPREKDPDTGYRYYSADQLEMLDHILMLKDMGMSLQEIREFLTLPDTADAVAILRRQQQVLRERQARLREAVARLDQKLATLEGLRGATPEQVARVELPAAPLALQPVDPPGEAVETDLALKLLLRTVRERRLPFVYQMGTRISPESLPLALQPVDPPGEAVETDLALKLLLRTVRERRLPFVYQMGTRISPESLAAGRYSQAFEVFFPLRRTCSSSLCRMRPAGTYLRCIHRGPYETVSETYARLLDTAQEQGLQVIGGSYEHCILDSMTVRTPEAYLTDVLLPVASKP